MPIKYPLNYYDESGRLKPPIFIYIFLLFVCRGFLILIVSLSFREDSEALIRLFYPHPYHFYLSLLPLLPAAFALYLVSYRNKLWKDAKYAIFKSLKPAMIMALVIDLLIQGYILTKLQFAFSMSHGVSICMCGLGLVYLIRSEYLKNLTNDWSRP